NQRAHVPELAEVPASCPPTALCSNPSQHPSANQMRRSTGRLGGTSTPEIEACPSYPDRRFRHRARYALSVLHSTMNLLYPWRGLQTMRTDVHFVKSTEPAHAQSQRVLESRHTSIQRASLGRRRGHAASGAA